MSADEMIGERTYTSKLADSDRALAVARITRAQPDAELLLDILGLGRPAVPVLRNIDGTASKRAQRRAGGAT